VKNHPFRSLIRQEISASTFTHASGRVVVVESGHTIPAVQTFEGLAEAANRHHIGSHIQGVDFDVIGNNAAVGEV